MSVSGSLVDVVPDYIPQILFVGYSKVGKSSLIRKMSGREIDASKTNASIGEDFVETSIPIGLHSKQQSLKTRLFDQQFDMGGSPNSILRRRDIIVLVWSLSDPESYRNIDTSLDTIYSIFDCHNPNPPDIVLCANKCDEMGTDNDLRLCRDKYTQFNVVKTSTIDGTGIAKLQSVFSELLSKRLHIPNPIDVVNIRPEVVNVERPEPNCC